MKKKINSVRTFLYLLHIFFILKLNLGILPEELSHYMHNFVSDVNKSTYLNTVNVIFKIFSFNAFGVRHPICIFISTFHKRYLLKKNLHLQHLPNLGFPVLEYATCK